MDFAWTPQLTAFIRTLAEAQGFALAGVAAAPAAQDDVGSATASRFAEWIEAGRAGDMNYLKRRSESGELLRSSARVTMPWARSVVVCALNYNLSGQKPAPRSIDPADTGGGWIARYAWTGDSEGRPTDYHDDLLHRLRAVEAALRERAPCQTRCYVDTGPVLERDFAVRAGLGWTGKNTCVLNQQQGSWLLLGVIVTSLPLDFPVALAPDRCGSCTRCLDACPTGALTAPRQMDASLCIAYLTIEKKGEIPIDLREPMGRQVFGCDICQEVCPWNRQAPTSAPEGLRRRDALINPALEWLASLDASAFQHEFAGSPLERTKRARLQRNVAIAMGNSGERQFRPRLEQWAQGDDPTLAESARWALERIHAEAALPTSASIGVTPSAWNTSRTSPEPTTSPSCTKAAKPLA